MDPIPTPIPATTDPPTPAPGRRWRRRPGGLRRAAGVALALGLFVVGFAGVAAASDAPSLTGPGGPSRIGHEEECVNEGCTQEEIDEIAYFC